MMNKLLFIFCVLSCVMMVLGIIGFAMDFSPKVYGGCLIGAAIFSQVAAMLDLLRESAENKLG